MAYRVAAVSFLNTIPLIDWFTRARVEQVQLTAALPSRLPDTLEDGQADTALVPVAEILRGRTGGVLSPSGIACRGAVGSVALFAADPLERVNSVRADRGSRSSVALSRVLLAEMFGLTPRYNEFRPAAGDLPGPGEALLVIGDACFAQIAALRRQGRDDVIMHDLGALWLELTGLPFVFAAWAASRAFAGGSRDSVAELGRLLTRSRDEGLQRLDVLAAQQAALGKLGHGGEATAAAIAYYFGESLCFTLGEEEIAGMRRFRELCRKHGLVPDLPFPASLYDTD